MAVFSVSSWCLLGKYLRKFATSKNFIKKFNFIMSFLLIVCVIMFYVQRLKFNSKNSFKSLDIISSSGKQYKIFNLNNAEKNGLDGISKLPKSLKVLLENLLRYEDDITVNKKQILALKDWLRHKKSNTEIAYRPARTLLQDYTGIPAIADLAAMRDAVKEKNKDPNKINPLSTVDLVIDHSVMVD